MGVWELLKVYYYVYSTLAKHKWAIITGEMIDAPLGHPSN